MFIFVIKYNDSTFVPIKAVRHIIYQSLSFQNPSNMKSDFKKYVIKGFIVGVFISAPIFSSAQDVDARSPKPNGGSSQQIKADKKKVKQQKTIAKGIEKGKKRHEKLQAKNTKKMMKQSKRKSKRWNENKKEFFLKRWFTRKHH